MTNLRLLPKIDLTCSVRGRIHVYGSGQRASYALIHSHSCGPYEVILHTSHTPQQVLAGLTVAGIPDDDIFTVQKYVRFVMLLEEALNLY